MSLGDKKKKETVFENLLGGHKLAGDKREDQLKKFKDAMELLKPYYPGEYARLKASFSSSDVLATLVGQALAKKQETKMMERWTLDDFIEVLDTTFFAARNPGKGYDSIVADRAVDRRIFAAERAVDRMMDNLNQDFTVILQTLEEISLLNSLTQSKGLNSNEKDSARRIALEFRQVEFRDTVTGLYKADNDLKKNVDEAQEKVNEKLGELESYMENKLPGVTLDSRVISKLAGPDAGVKKILTNRLDKIQLMFSMNPVLFIFIALPFSVVGFTTIAFLPGFKNLTIFKQTNNLIGLQQGNSRVWSILSRLPFFGAIALLRSINPSSDLQDKIINATGQSVMCSGISTLSNVIGIIKKHPINEKKISKKDFDSVVQRRRTEFKELDAVAKRKDLVECAFNLGGDLVNLRERSDNSYKMAINTYNTASKVAQDVLETSISIPRAINDFSLMGELSAYDYEFYSAKHDFDNSERDAAAYEKLTVAFKEVLQKLSKDTNAEHSDLRDFADNVRQYVDRLKNAKNAEGEIIAETKSMEPAALMVGAPAIFGDMGENFDEIFKMMSNALQDETIHGIAESLDTDADRTVTVQQHRDAAINGEPNPFKVEPSSIIGVYVGLESLESLKSAVIDGGRPWDDEALASEAITEPDAQQRAMTVLNNFVQYSSITFFDGRDLPHSVSNMDKETQLRFASVGDEENFKIITAVDLFNYFKDAVSSMEQRYKTEQELQNQFSEPAVVPPPPASAVAAAQALYGNQETINKELYKDNTKLYKEIKGLVSTLLLGDESSDKPLYRRILSALTGQPVVKIAPGAVTEALEEPKDKTPSEQNEVLKQVNGLLDRCVQANAVESMYANVTDKITVQDVLEVFDGKTGDVKSLNSKKVEELKSRAQATIGFGNQNSFGG